MSGMHEDKGARLYGTGYHKNRENGKIPQKAKEKKKGKKFFFFYWLDESAQLWAKDMQNICWKRRRKRVPFLGIGMNQMYRKWMAYHMAAVPFHRSKLPDRQQHYLKLIARASQTQPILCDGDDGGWRWLEPLLGWEVAGKTEPC